MGILQRLKLWLKPKPKQPDWQTILRQRAALLSQLNQNLSNLAWQTCSQNNRGGVFSRLKSAVCWVLQNVKRKLKSCLPKKLKICLSNLHQLTSPLRRQLVRLLLPVRRWLITRLSKLKQWLRLRLLLFAIRNLMPRLISWLLKQFVTPWTTALKCGLATKPSKPEPTSKPLLNTNQLWLSKLVTVSSWLKTASRLFGFFASGSSVSRKSCRKSSGKVTSPLA